MSRLTARRNGGVGYMANKEYKPAALMDSREVYIVLKRLAEYEDQEEQLKEEGWKHGENSKIQQG